LFGLKLLTKKIIVAAGQLGLTGEAEPIFFQNPRKTAQEIRESRSGEKVIKNGNRMRLGANYFQNLRS
jgi:hypothetical protein